MTPFIQFICNYKVIIFFLLQILFLSFMHQQYLQYLQSIFLFYTFLKQSALKRHKTSIEILSEIFGKIIHLFKIVMRSFFVFIVFNENYFRTNEQVQNVDLRYLVLFLLERHLRCKDR